MVIIIADPVLPSIRIRVRPCFSRTESLELTDRTHRRAIIFGSRNDAAQRRTITAATARPTAFVSRIDAIRQGVAEVLPRKTAEQPQPSTAIYLRFADQRGQEAMEVCRVVARLPLASSTRRLFQQRNFARCSTDPVDVPTIGIGDERAEHNPQALADELEFSVDRIGSIIGLAISTAGLLGVELPISKGRSGYALVIFPRKSGQG